MSDKHEIDPDVPQALWDSYTTQAAEDSTMLAPAEVRRLGGRRRTRRRVGIASSALALALVAGSALALNTDMFGTREPPFAATPTPSTSSPSMAVSTPTQTTSSPSVTPPVSQPPASTGSGSPTASTSTKSPSAPASTSASPSAAPLTKDNLPTGKEIYLTKAGDMSFEDQDNFGYAGESMAHSICEPDLGLSKLTPQHQAARWFSGAQPGAASSTTVLAFAMDYDVTADANATVAKIRGWYDGCQAKVKPAGGRISAEPALTQDGATVWYWTGQGAFDPTSESQSFENIMLIQSGSRILLILESIYGQDNNGVGPYGHTQDPDLPIAHFAKHYPQVITRVQS